MMQYRVFGLTVESPFEIGRMSPCELADGGKADVTIRFESVEKRLENPLNRGVIFEANDDEFLLKIEEVGAMLIRDGSEIAIDPAPEADEKKIEMYLQSMAIPALLNQRGFFLLHANAVVTKEGKAVLVMGESGAGKSTTAQALCTKKRFENLSDDLAALRYDEEKGCVTVSPGYPYTKLWQKSAGMLGIETEGLARVAEGREKYIYPTTKPLRTAPCELQKIYFLRQSRDATECRVEDMEVFDKIRSLEANTYRKRFINNLRAKNRQFDMIRRLVERTDIAGLIRPERSNTVDSLCDLITSDLYG